MLKVGVIGVGTMGRHHARIYSELPGVQLVGVADTDKEAAAKVAGQFGARSFADSRALLKEGLDAVSIAVPTSVHRDVAIAAASAGANVLLENPIADTLDNAARIIAACKQNGTTLMIGHVERFNPVYRAIRQKMADWHAMCIDITGVGPLPPRIKDVGVVIDLAVHDIDIMRYLTGSEIKRVHSLITTSQENGKEDTALISLEMDNGVLGHITTNWLTPFKVREINVSAREKFIRGWLLEQKICEYQSLGEDGCYKVSEMRVPYVEPLKLELEAFLHSVAQHQPAPVSGEDGLKALEVAFKCLASGGPR